MAKAAVPVDEADLIDKLNTVKGELAALRQRFYLQKRLALSQQLTDLQTRINATDTTALLYPLAGTTSNVGTTIPSTTIEQGAIPLTTTVATTSSASIPTTPITSTTTVSGGTTIVSPTPTPAPSGATTTTTPVTTVNGTGTQTDPWTAQSDGTVLWQGKGWYLLANKQAGGAGVSQLVDNLDFIHSYNLNVLAQSSAVTSTVTAPASTTSSTVIPATTSVSSSTVSTIPEKTSANTFYAYNGWQGSGYYYFAAAGQTTGYITTQDQMNQANLILYGVPLGQSGKYTGVTLDAFNAGLISGVVSTQSSTAVSSTKTTTTSAATSTASSVSGKLYPLVIYYPSTGYKQDTGTQVYAPGAPFVGSGSYASSSCGFDGSSVTWTPGSTWSAVVNVNSTTDYTAYKAAGQL